jgi:hypothetical protein
MEPEDLELMLDEMGIDEENIAEVVAQLTPSDTVAMERKLHSDEILALEMQNEPDWRKRASMAAAIIKMHLED